MKTGLWNRLNKCLMVLIESKRDEVKINKYGDSTLEFAMREAYNLGMEHALVLEGRREENYHGDRL
jgi:hypothetical protein